MLCATAAHIIFFSCLGKCSSDSLSTGATVALSCTLTFLLSVITTAIITFIITFMCVKRTTLHEKTMQLSNKPCGFYGPMSLSNQTPTTNNIELDPAYIQVSDCVANKDVIVEEKDPAYEQHNL